jgi:hypothetical protein
MLMRDMVAKRTSLFPPPWRGRGRVGGNSVAAGNIFSTPTPDPSPQGGGVHTVPRD